MRQGAPWMPTAPPGGSQVSPGSMTPLPQFALQPAFGVCTHRKALPAESQESSVQGLVSLQLTGNPPQALFAQTSFSVQGFPSSQGFELATKTHDAEPLQLSVVHGFPSSQSPSP